MGGGGKGRQATPAPSPYEQEAAKIAQQTYTESAPLRQDILSQLLEFTQGGFDPTTSPIYAPRYNTARTGAEAQYGVAKQNILAGTPRGGGQIDALAGLETSRAAQVGEIPGLISTDIINDLMQKAYGVAFNAPQQSMAGLSSISNSYANRYASAQQAAGQGKAGLLGGLGSLGQGAGYLMAGPRGLLGK